MKTLFNAGIPAVIAVCLGCASMSTPTMRLPLQNGSGTYEISYRHVEVPADYNSTFESMYGMKAPANCSNYWVSLDLSGGYSLFDYKSVSMNKQLLEKALPWGDKNALIRHCYTVSFYRTKHYDAAPAFFVTVDGKKHQLPYRTGSVRTTSYARGAAAVSTQMSYYLTDAVLNSMKDMKSLSLKIGEVSWDLDAKGVSRTRSFIADAGGFDYQNFHDRVLASKK